MRVEEKIDSDHQLLAVGLEGRRSGEKRKEIRWKKGRGERVVDGGENKTVCGVLWKKGGRRGGD